METKKHILIRTYLVFLVLSLFCIAILSKAIYIQVVEGADLKALAAAKRVRVVEIEAERGSIISENNFVLSTSVPEFDIYIDFRAQGLIENNGALFRENLDSLSMGLASVFRDKRAAEYRKILRNGFARGDRFVLLKRKISFTQYEDLKKLPLVRLGKNKSGFIAEVRMKRLYPFKSLGNRTIGIARDSNKVGLERRYDKYLSGTTGRRLVRYISGNVAMPVEDALNIDPNDGYDIITTLNPAIQDIAHQALEKMMVSNEALYGTCIVMEVKTGKIRAIANLGRQADGSYWEDYNYALRTSEPGSTWKLTTLMAALEDGKINLSSRVNLEGGIWKVAGETVFDSETHGLYEATVQQAFEKSSNVGMAKIAVGYYTANPDRYFSYLHKWHMDTITGIDLPGESKPLIYKPGHRMWSRTTLPWMGFGYNLTITPMHTAMLYNAVANGGVMMKPYLVSAVVREGEVLAQYNPAVIAPRICNAQTLQQVKTSLEGVVLRGTAAKLQTPLYRFAGKTGTSLVADVINGERITYQDKMYQSSFAGYFPADNPEYTIVVVIRNKKHARVFYGGSVAGPVFREVADRLFAGYMKQQRPFAASRTDSVQYDFAGTGNTMKTLAASLGIRYYDSANAASVSVLSARMGKVPVMKPQAASGSTVPLLHGVGLKDALALCEERGLTVEARGRGRVQAQSVPAGSILPKGSKVILTLN